ncbi:uncharacterized protein LOC111435250 [Cucurbita moschata]|uniref:Uncharacterized protein LOC111435250 n=1 Tax=Cucurbita moschata TaxID=3662 RepID=A0A6J1EKV0_CUCMO|nr:uncharacterized protein LOC111435250 [Cucurbita moschata]
MKKESLSNMVKQMACGLRAMVKRKARALKARLIIYSLLAQSNFLVSSIPLSTVTHQQNQCQIQAADLEKAQEHQGVVEEETGAETGEETGAETGEETGAETGEWAELETEAAVGRTNGWSVIEMVKNSKEEAGEEFSLEKDIDDVADLFIRNFHSQMRMQKQNSLNRYHKMLSS